MKQQDTKAQPQQPQPAYVRPRVQDLGAWQAVTLQIYSVPINPNGLFSPQGDRHA